MRASAAVCLALLAGCGSVDAPEEHWYRIEVPRPAPRAARQGGVLRVAGLELAPSLAGDRLQVAEGAVALRPFLLHHWAGPLDQMLTQGLVLGLARAELFAEVKGPAAPGGEDYVLSGHVLDCHAVRGPDGLAARITLRLQLKDGAASHQPRVLCEAELTRTVAAEVAAPEPLVRALGWGFHELVEEWLVRSDEVLGAARAMAPKPR